MGRGYKPPGPDLTLRLHPPHVVGAATLLADVLGREDDRQDRPVGTTADAVPAIVAGEGDRLDHLEPTGPGAVEPGSHLDAGPGVHRRIVNPRSSGPLATVDRRPRH